MNKLAMTLGDPVGIGPEIAVKTLLEFDGDDRAHGIAVGDADTVRRAIDVLGVRAQVNVLSDWSDDPSGPGIIDVMDIGVLTELPEWGKVSAEAGRAAVTSIEVATKAALDGKVAGIVTGPINKEAIWKSGSTFLGHTEMLGNLTGVANQDTMFVCRSHSTPDHALKIFFATRHLSLRNALDAITIDTQYESIMRAHTALQVFGHDHPRLAVAAINPHGGEGGHFGTEEIDILAPAIERAKESGVDVTGPIPSDSVFHHGLSGRYDGVLSQYHDQGHIASKTYDFDGTISVTVGLPILRTSVDHGTAFDIAGQGIADHGTMRSAYLAGIEYAPFADRIRKHYSPQS